MPYTLEIKILEAPTLINENYHRHWSVKYRERKKWQRLIAQAIRFQYPEEPLQRAQITITRGSSRQPDFDNMVISAKSLLDSLVKLNVILDDSPQVLEDTIYKWEKAARGEKYVKITVKEIPAETLEPRTTKTSSKRPRTSNSE